KRRVDGQSLPPLDKDGGAYLWAEMLPTYSVPDPARTDLTNYIAPGDIVIFGKRVGDASETGGHAAIVESVHPDRIEISEGNWGGNNFNTRDIERTADYFADLRFSH
ncbi:MAG: CHAP domain-containing protein, partial [Anaerolineae bacterium]|nr:CHAP domain-containing protein [Anaerolineae bacterium]NIN95659.1 CHAP domain-containing protein [Anaerolineae bacterium]NIQ78614.1 CHAP domain-containing protein [Anaerolineae bacterium]